MQTLSIIIPIYNEEKLIEQAIVNVLKADTVGFRKEIILIDDGSTDNTKDRIKKFLIKRKTEGNSSQAKIILVEQKNNKGKGASLKIGFQKASGNVFLVQDADGEYFVDDYPSLLAPFLQNKTQVVFGSRNKKRENFHNRYSYFVYYVGGLFLSWFINVLYGLELTDQPTGYKLFSSRMRKLLLIPNENRFSYEVAITALFAKNNIQIKEVPIHYKPRTIEEGKKINGLDFINSLFTAVKYRFIDTE